MRRPLFVSSVLTLPIIAMAALVGLPSILGVVVAVVASGYAIAGMQMNERGEV